ncbi:HAL/PAL/TAL family ammonia-lyase [Phytomonospora endophytica]|uniref:Histidine ammonia-lyase/phenylalanine ammonia-lyase n=1 Tax=Phytomonospora endophytica TaxID=714109 RepID=A0A841G3I5_9ACTN|nr:aromatic amino acid ammonia-lyase [Phytomonospora endophytica]MBB6038680.1 histidine ammonia-lyase/phenylalanine ammonia-lyase [Phytomonospora endophytica]GIG69175.1 histidine ammonia-lyase [Phytomonospora endophytica]
MTITEHPHAGATQLTVSLGGDTLGIADIAAIARRSEAVAVTVAADARERMRASVALRDDLIATGQPIYGVTTGVGNSVTTHLSPERAEYMMAVGFRKLLVGSGPAAAPDVTRAMMLVRANCLARGHSAIRPEAVDLILAFLGRDILPIVPECGSVGASGDLAPLAYLVEVLTGGGTVLHRGLRRSTTEVLAEEGLSPLRLQPKEGMALLNGTSFMAAFAALAVHDATELALVSDVCTALAVEALTGNMDHFHPRLHAQKPHPGQVRSAARIRSLLDGSRLAVTHADILAATPTVGSGEIQRVERGVQDRYSIRCAPHVAGVLADTLDCFKTWVEVEVNSSNDNPLFDVDLGIVHNGGHFYGGHMGQAGDALKLAVANVADLLDRQLALLVDAKYNRGLPDNLVRHHAVDDPRAGMHHGLKGTQIAASALTAEALYRAAPATLHSRSTEAHNQDKVSMGATAVRGARDVVELTGRVAAIHLLAACQAVDLRGGPQMLADGTRAAYEAVRGLVPFVDVEGRLDEDLASIARFVAEGGVGRAVAGSLPNC